METGEKSTSINRLSKISLATHDCEDKHASFLVVQCIANVTTSSFCKKVQANHKPTYLQGLGEGNAKDIMGEVSKTHQAIQ